MTDILIILFSNLFYESIVQGNNRYNNINIFISLYTILYESIMRKLILENDLKQGWQIGFYESAKMKGN